MVQRAAAIRGHGDPRLQLTPERLARLGFRQLPLLVLQRGGELGRRVVLLLDLSPQLVGRQLRGHRDEDELRRTRGFLYAWETERWLRAQWRTCVGRYTCNRQAKTLFASHHGSTGA